MRGLTGLKLTVESYPAILGRMVQLAVSVTVSGMEVYTGGDFQFMILRVKRSIIGHL